MQPSLSKACELCLSESSSTMEVFARLKLGYCPLRHRCMLQYREMSRQQCGEGLRWRHLEGLVVHDHGQVREGRARLEVLLHLGELVGHQALEVGQCTVCAIGAALLRIKAARITPTENLPRQAQMRLQTGVRDTAEPIVQRMPAGLSVHTMHACFHCQARLCRSPHADQYFQRGSQRQGYLMQKSSMDEALKRFLMLKHQ